MGYFIADSGILAGNTVIDANGLTVAGNILVANDFNVNIGTDLVVTGNIFVGNLLNAAGNSYLGTQEKILYQPGPLVTTVGQARWYPPASIVVNTIKALLGTPCTGQAAQIRIKVSGVESQVIEIPANSSAFVTTAVQIPVTSADYLTVDVIQRGSINTGSDLHVIFYY